MTINNIDLKELERKVYRSTYQDGLWDIYQGGLICSFAIFAGAWEGNETLSTWQRMAIFLAGIGLSYLIFWAGKKYLILPRIGRVKFGPLRERRKRTLFAVMGAIVGFQVLIVAFTIALWNFPALREAFGFPAMPRRMEALVVAVTGALFVGPSLALVAYFNDFPRGYYIAAVLSLAVFCLIWFESAAAILVAGALVLLPGLVLFIRFLNRYPLPPHESPNA